jgi:hypothetical protein
MQIDFNLAKSLTELADYFLALPEKLVEAGMQPFAKYYGMKERIARGKELVELREIAKLLQRLYISKGSILPFLRQPEAERPNSAELTEEVQWFVNEVLKSLTLLSELSRTASFGSFTLAAEGALRIGQAQAFWRQLEGLSGSELIATGRISSLAAELERLQASGTPLLEAVDQYRLSLDRTG